MATTIIKETAATPQRANLWKMTRARTRLKAARDEIGEIRIYDDTGELILELLRLIDGVGKLLDKRIKAAKESMP